MTPADNAAEQLGAAREGLLSLRVSCSATECVARTLFLSGPRYYF